ncbi:MAG: GNAT family N-acetyltransferase [Ginsengibacter sp.]
MNITKATTEDIPHLEKLINSAYRGEESKKGWTTEADLLVGKRIDADGIEKIMSQPGAVILKCCNDNNEFAGCVYLKKNDNKMYLGMLTVSPTLQAGGIGKKILKEAEVYAAENTCDAIEMRVVSVRHELIAWYQRHGYHDTGKTEPFGDASALSVQTQPLEFIIMGKSL